MRPGCSRDWMGRARRKPSPGWVVLMASSIRQRTHLRVLAWLLTILAAQACFAHPMGNFSINHYAGIRIDKGTIEVLYLIDRAEIPTYQEMQDAGIVPQVGDASLPPYLAREAAEWVKNIRLEVDGQIVVLTPVSKSVIFPPGAGGLPTMKIGVLYRGTIREAGGTVHLHYLDENFAGHAGWKEIVVAAGKGVTLDANQPYKVDRSAQLTDYPTNLLNSPPQDVEARFDYVVGATAAPQTAKQSAEVASQVTLV